MLRKLVVAGLLVVAMGAFAGNAQAIGYSQAWSIAWNDNVTQCHVAGSGFYRCQIANWEYPSCRWTGVNRPGVAQWQCTSAFVQSSNTPYLTGRICNRALWLDPYGHTVYSHNACVGIGGVGFSHWRCHRRMATYTVRTTGQPTVIYRLPFRFCRWIP